MFFVQDSEAKVLKDDSQKTIDQFFSKEEEKVEADDDLVRVSLIMTCKRIFNSEKFFAPCILSSMLSLATEANPDPAAVDLDDYSLRKNPTYYYY